MAVLTRLADIAKVAAALPRVPIHYPPGHFYSPIPSKADIARAGQKLDPLGVDLNEAEQEKLVEEFSALPLLPFTDEPHPAWRYHYRNGFFLHGDAFMYAAMLTTRRPRRVVEVGSGFSSALALDVTQGWPDAPAFTFIEPHPERLNRLLRPGDEVEVVVQEVQDTRPWEGLEADDFLFIDSSHVAKAGSDVCYLLFDVLPRLAPGVVVHVHDIYAGFEYPRKWLEEGRGWNEAYLLRAFLSANQRWRVLLFNSWLGQARREMVGEKLPLFARNPGGSLWMTSG